MLLILTKVNLVRDFTTDCYISGVPGGFFDPRPGRWSKIYTQRFSVFRFSGFYDEVSDSFLKTVARDVAT